ncbi:MAG: hypothetical protein WCG87_10625 [Bacteroidota bacterium]
MKLKQSILFIILFAVFSISPSIHALAQEEGNAVYASKHYVDMRLHDLNKYNHQIEKQQDRLLKKLQRKENKFANKLKQMDSTAYAKLKSQLVVQMIVQLELPKTN